MFNIVKKTINWGGRDLTLETGRIARQANGAVLIKYAGTTILCTVCGQKEAKEGQDFFPLTVIYQEKAFAAGKIPGGFFKREAKPREKETLTSRLIDRPIRPLFPEEFKGETQIICTVLEFDGETDSDIPALIGASAALAISELPFAQTLGAARVSFKGDSENPEFELNPALGFADESKLDLVVAATSSSIMMVESEAKVISENQMLAALEFAHQNIKELVSFIDEFAAEARKVSGKEKWEIVKKDNSELKKIVKDAVESDIVAAYQITAKQQRVEAISIAKDKLKAKIAELAEAGQEFCSVAVDGEFKALQSEVVRGDLIKNKRRIDGRKPEEIRQIIGEVGVLPATHGSALFTRGETQALVVATLGTEQDAQRIDGLEGDTIERFMLHYNFPPYSVGEASRMGPPGRREIGHGKLAWRAINAVVPSKEEFPCTMRIVSEITESNGSSSMATVCGTSMALMDAGAPVKDAVSGIAMGLVLEGDDYVILSDIMGDEDHLGDMDFKVAGTASGLTSLQMDIKVQGITIEIMKNALNQAKDGRLHILNEMSKAITQPRDNNPNAPKFVTIQVPPHKIREIIGQGGKVIKNICEVSGAKIDIEDSGEVRVSSTTSTGSDKAVEMIMEIAAEPIVGETYAGKVMKIMDFGAIVQFMGKQQGLVHISEIAHERVENVADYLNAGDDVTVKLVSIDKSGKVKLSIKQLLEKPSSSEEQAEQASNDKSDEAQVKQA